MTLQFKIDNDKALEILICQKFIDIDRGLRDSKSKRGFRSYECKVQHEITHMLYEGVQSCQRFHVVPSKELEMTTLRMINLKIPSLTSKYDAIPSTASKAAQERRRRGYRATMLEVDSA